MGRERRGNQRNKAEELTCEFCLLLCECESCELQHCLGIRVTWRSIASADHSQAGKWESLQLIAAFEAF